MSARPPDPIQQFVFAQQQLVEHMRSMLKEPIAEEQLQVFMRSQIEFMDRVTQVISAMQMGQQAQAMALNEAMTTIMGGLEMIFRTPIQYVYDDDGRIIQARRVMQ